MICRAGGSTLAEALAWKIPAVSVPWLASAENHQVKNAQCFVKLGGGLVYHGESLADLIIKLFDANYNLKSVNLKPCETLYNLAEI